jgi:hypothetical protein
MKGTSVDNKHSELSSTVARSEGMEHIYQLIRDNKKSALMKLHLK